MKWALVAVIAVLLILACIVYIRYERRLPVPTPVAGTPAALPRPKAARPPQRKPELPNAVDISGPLKDRGLVHWVLPDYPEWAQQQGIGGVYRTKIWVTPAGHVQSFMQPQQLSSEPRLDEKAVEALRQWQFVEKPNAFGDQWGIVKISFSLLAQKNAPTEASIHGVSLGAKTISGAWECVHKWMGDAYVYICKLHPSP